MLKVVLCCLVLCAAGALAGSATGSRPTTEELRALRQRQPARSLLEGKHKIELGDKPSDDDEGCSEWKVGTVTGYSTDGTDKGDLPMAPNDLGEYIVPGKFFKSNNVVAVDWSDWGSTKYKYIDVSMEGKIGRMEVWDFCNDKDCSPDNENCCSNNMKEFTDKDGSGFLLDIETHALKRVWDFDDAQNWIVAPAHYRICGRIPYEDEVDEFNMECRGVEGDQKCGFESGDSKDSKKKKKKKKDN